MKLIFLVALAVLLFGITYAQDCNNPDYTPITTCTQAEPITASGGYCLPDPLYCPSFDPILIQTSDVIIDCQGNSLTGDPSQPYSAITAAASYDNITVQNCNLSGWGGNALYYQGNTNSSIINTSSESDAGEGYGQSGIEMDDPVNDTLINVNAIGAQFGLYMDYSYTGCGNNTIMNTTATEVAGDNEAGIEDYQCSGDVFENVNATSGDESGMQLDDTNNETMINVNATGYTYGFLGEDDGVNDIMPCGNNTIINSYGEASQDSGSGSQGGIYFTQCSGDSIQNSDGNSYGAGILFWQEANGTINNSTGEAASWGIGSYESNGTQILNSIANTSTYGGNDDGLALWLEQDTGDTIQNSIGETDASSDGIYADQCQNETFINDTGNAGVNDGIELDYYNELSSCEQGCYTDDPSAWAPTSAPDGISPTPGWQSCLSSCTSVIPSENNQIINSTGEAGSLNGILMNGGFHNSLIGSTATITQPGGSVSLFMQYGTNEILNDDNLTQPNGSGSTVGLYMGGEQNDTIANSTITDDGESSDNGFYAVQTAPLYAGFTDPQDIADTVLNTFINNTIISQEGYTGGIDDGGFGNTFFWNSFNDPMDTVSDGAGYFQDGTGTDTLSGDPSNDYDYSGVLACEISTVSRFPTLTLAQAEWWTPCLPVPANPEGNIWGTDAAATQAFGISSGTPSLYGVGWTIGASQYDDSTTIYNIADYYPLLPPPPCDCGTLTTPNYVCNVPSDQVSYGTCYIIQANNVTINCDGYTINGESSTTNAITSTGYSGTNINGCNIIGFLQHGIDLSGVSNATITNNIISANVEYPLILLTDGDNISIINETLSNPNIEGIDISLVGVSNSTLANSNLSGGDQLLELDGDLVHEIPSDFNTLANNTLTSYGSGMEFIDSATNNSIVNNTLVDNPGIQFSDSSDSNNTVWWNTFTGSTQYVSDFSGDNFYNTSVCNGVTCQQEGNIYADVISDIVKIGGSTPSIGFPDLFVGTAGSGYPFNYSTSSGKFDCEFYGCADYAPLTDQPPAPYLHCDIAPGILGEEYVLNITFTQDTDYYVYPTNQTNPSGFYQCTNTGGSTGTVYIAQNDTNPNVDTIASDDYFVSSIINLTTTPQEITTLVAGQEVNISLYRNYTDIHNTVFKDVTENLSIS